MASRPGKTPQKQEGEDVAPATKKAKIEVTDPRTSKQVGSGDMDEDLICLLCKEIFKDPIIIMCGHNFCRGCMDKAWKGDTFTCPFCQKVINSKMYIPNQAVANLVKKMAGAAPALPVKKAPVPTHCREHDEVLKLFCKDDGALTCMVCRDSLKHAGHSFLPIADTLEMYRQKLTAIVTPLEEAMKATEQLVDQQNEKIEQKSANLDECEQHIVAEFEKVRDFLQEKQEAMLVKLREQGKDLRTDMQSAVTQMQKSKGDLSQAIAVAKEKTKETKATSFLSNIKSFIEQCEKQQKEALSSRKTLVDKELNLRTFKGPIEFSVWKEMKSLFVPDVQNDEVQQKEPPKGNSDTCVQSIEVEEEEMAMEESDAYAQVEEPQQVAPPVVRTSTKAKQIWIIGHSLIARAEKRARSSPYGHDLGFGKHNCTVHWMAKVGMMWDDLASEMERKVAVMGAPDILVVHLGGNDLEEVTALNLKFAMRRIFTHFSQRYTGTIVFWSSIVPRAEWIFTGIEKARKDCNQGMSWAAKKDGFKIITHFGVEKKFRNRCMNKIKNGETPDLSDAELDIFNVDIRETIKVYV
ncbi:nuclear factor 7, brain-like [Hyperolius riggenbachi]|uniref:nuclear factor 7, brain-like n=1 Tax=Hyperolius riggenbachi TaxID=752182 RepID=UPI0035A330B3